MKFSKIGVMMDKTKMVVGAACGLMVVACLLFTATACSSRSKEINPQDSADVETMIEYADSSECDYNDGRVCQSEDGCITIESGMAPDGGTSPDFWARWSVKDDKGNVHIIKYAVASYQNKIHTITKADGTVFYIVKCFDKACSVDGYEWLEAYKIVGDTIQEVNVLDGNDYDGKHVFRVNYNIPSWYDSTKGAGYDWILHYDVHTKNLYVPITDDRRDIIDRYQVWHFDGNRFVFQGEKPHPNLHKSLADYTSLLCYATTRDYIIRIDSTDGKTLRYASWKRPKTMADKPDIIITGGGQYRCVVEADEFRPCDDYRFSNGSYEYIVNYCEVTDLGNGLGEHHDFLVVKHNGKIVKKQELNK